MLYIVPDQTNSTFDYFMYKALRVLFKDDYFAVMQKHQPINIGDDDLLDRGFDLFTLLLNRNKDNFDLLDQRVG